MGQALEMCVNCETKRSCDTCTDLHNWIMEHLDAKQEWISVKDRLPEQLKEVLICFDNYGRKCVSVATYRDYFYSKEWLSNMVSLSVDCVTHWMPLPEPPTEGGRVNGRI